MVGVSAECRPLYWPRYLPIVIRYVDHHSADILDDTSVDTSPDTSRPTYWPPLDRYVSIDISIECQSTYRPMLDRCVARYIERHISVDISTDTRPICRLTYRSMHRSTVCRYVDRDVDRYIGRGVHKIHMIQFLYMAHTNTTSTHTVSLSYFTLIYTNRPQLWVERV